MGPMQGFKRLWTAVLVAAAASAQNPRDISFILATKGGRTQFAAGETVGMELQISTVSPAQYQVWISNTTRTVRQPRFDHFTVEPDSSGVVDPLQDIFAQKEGGIIAGAMPRPVPLSNQPVVIELFLNEWLSLRQPGHYRITAETTRVMKSSSPGEPVSLRSNAIDIEVLAAKPDWVSTQLRQAIATLEEREPPAPVVGQTVDLRSFQQHDHEMARAGRTLRFLESREAVLLLARFFENAPGAAQQQLRAGLFGSPFRQDVIAAMENSVGAPGFPVTYYYLATLMELQQLRRLGPTPLYTARTPEEIKRWVDEVEAPRRIVARRVEGEYFAKLAEAIKRKHGRALAVSVDTLISRGPQPPGAEAIRALTDSFADLPESTQHSLLTINWPRIASPSIAPLVKTLASGSSPMRDAALERLRELDQEAARRIATDRIRRGDVVRNAAGSDPRPLLNLPDKTLPDLDNAMLTALEHGKPVDLLIARYASKAALPRVLSFMERSPGSICSSGLLAYLFRVQPSSTADLVTQARVPGRGGCSINLTPYEDLLVTPGLERQAIADLSNPDPMTRRSAQALLQNGGSPQAEQPLWEAMSRIRDHEPGPLNTDEFGISEALSKAVAWTLTPEKIDRLITACRSDSCRVQASAMRRWLAEPISITMPAFSNAYANVGLFTLRSRTQLEQKLSQFPKGTSFFVDVRESTWYGNRRRDEIRKILEASGMRFVDRGSQAAER